MSDEHYRLGGVLWKELTERIRDDVSSLNRDRTEDNRLTIGWKDEHDFSVSAPGIGNLVLYISASLNRPHLAAHVLRPGRIRSLVAVAVMLREEGGRLVGYQLMQSNGREVPIVLETPEAMAEFFLRTLLEDSEGPHDAPPS